MIGAPRRTPRGACYSFLEREIIGLNEQRDELIKRRKAKAEKICPFTEDNKAMMAKLSRDLEVQE